MWGRQKGGASLEIRAHHLLCLLGFCGLGYSQEFVENMKEVSATVFSDQDFLKIIDWCDDICAFCPHRSGDKCAKKEDLEQEVRQMDKDVAGRLGIEIGTELQSQEVWGLVKERIAPLDLPEICKGCEWLNLRYCAEGLGNLRG